MRKDAAQTLLDGMTTQEKICQLLIVHPEALTGGGTVTGTTDELAAALREYPVGGLLLSAGNMTSRANSLQRSPLRFRTGAKRCRSSRSTRRAAALRG